MIYLAGKRCGGHQVICAMRVDSEGSKQVLVLSEGATENAQVVKGLLEDLVARVVSPGRRLFVIDGSKALRAAIDQVYGKGNPVQRCRYHKRENVLGCLLQELRRQVGAALSAAWKLEPKEGMARLGAQIEWLERTHPKAAASLRETFTINRLGLSARLRRCLATPNNVESSLSGVEVAPGG